MTPVHEKTYKDLTIKIYQDDSPDSPREWDNLGTMACFHRRYNLGDKHQFEDPGELLTFLKQSKAPYLPLYLYDHSGISMSTNRGYPFNNPWDSGQVGIIYVTPEKIRKEYNVKHITKVIRAKVIDCLIQEAVTYNDYLTGNVYGFVILDKTGELLDSCYGFYPDHDNKPSITYCLEQARESADYCASEIWGKEIDKANRELATAM
jgi:hypothetical protein